MRNIIATLLLGLIVGSASAQEVFNPVMDFEVPVQPPEMRPGYALEGKGLHSAVPRGQQGTDCVINPVSLRTAFTEVKTTELVAGQIIEIPVNVLFDFDGDFVRPEGLDALTEFYDALVSNDVESIKIVGHTDSKGTDEYNLDLGFRRAAAVASALVAAGFDASAIEIDSAGESQPKVPNTLEDGTDDPVGRQTNRRVDVEITKVYDQEVEVAEIVEVRKNPQIFHVLGSNNSVTCMGTPPGTGIGIPVGGQAISNGGVVITVPPR